MIEPVSASAFGLGVFGNFLKNCIETISAGGEAHHAYRHLIGHLKERLNDGRVPANHDLNNAIEQSLLEAARAFALGVAAQLDPQPALFEAIGHHLRDFKFNQPLLDMLKVPGRDWVEELLKESRRAHGEHGIEAEFILDENEVTKLLVDRAPDKFQQRVNKAFADWLERHVQNAAKPDCVNDFLTKGWPVEKDSNKRITFYQAFCLFFHEKVKHRPEVVNILLAQTLSNVAENQKALETLPEQVANILKKLNEQKLASFDNFQSWLGDQFAQLKIWLEAKFEKVYAGQAETNRLVTEVKEILQPSSSKAGPEEKLPDTIKQIFEEAGKLAEADKDAEAKAKYEEARNHPDAVGFPILHLKAKMGIASVVRRHDSDTARKLFCECLRELPETASDRLREDLLGRLGELEAHTGNLLEAKAYLSEAQKVATRLGDNICLACNLEALATLEERHGRLDEAIKLFDEAAELLMTEYQRHDPKTEKQAMMILGICFTNKSLTQKHKADLLGALSSLEQAIEWFRKADIQDDHFAETMLLFAEAKFADEKWDDGLQALQESLRSAKKRDDYMGICKCLKLAGKLKFTFGDEKGALGDFAAALDLMRKRSRPDQLLDYLDKVARVAAKHGSMSEARKLLIEAKEIAEKHERLEDCADAVLDLAELEDGSDADAKRKEALRTAIGYLEKLLPRTQVKGRKAFLVGRIGLLHQRLGDLDNALARFTGAKELYEKIGDVWGIVNSLGSIADVKRLQDKPDEEMNLYRQILTIAEGKPLGDFVARAKNNMGVRLMQTGFLREAQQLLKEADELCRKKHIRELHPEVLLNIERVQQLIEVHKPTSVAFPDLIRELHELGDFFPEAKKSILTFWYYWRDIELHSNCRSLLGVKLLISEDDTSRFLALAERLTAYSDLNLQVLTTKHPEFGMDFVPWPKGKPIPERVAKAEVMKIRDSGDGQLMAMRFVRGGIHWPYTETADEARSKQTGREAIVICGHARGLPSQAHELMFGQTADALIAKKVAFFPWDRSSTESRLADDLSLAKEQSLIPLYAEQLPGTEDVEETAHVALAFPVIAPNAADQIGRQVAEVKRKLVRLLLLKDDEAVAALTEIAGLLDELRATSGASECIRMTAYLLRFPVHGAMQTHLALVRKGAEGAGS